MNEKAAVNERTCDQCGRLVPEDSPGGLCPRCLAGGVLGNESADDWLNPAPDRAGEVIGGWEILARLGEGAFGEVFQVAEAESRGDAVREGALKILKADLNSREALARFDAERQALAQLDHPNITRIFDTGETDQGRPWFVMEYVDGEPVTDFCRFRELLIRERLEIFRTVCEAANHAHRLGIVHRDLKPSNVLVSTGDDGEPIVKLIDFGVAKAVELPLTHKTLFTHAGVLIGTPEYMSPEQAAGKSLDLDARADVYSLGVLLYELLTGTTPIGRSRFREAAFDEVLRLVREVEAKRPSKTGHRNKIAPELDWIVLKALEKNREQRYADSGELAEDIGRFLETKPIRARRPSRIGRAGKFVARNRKAAIGIGAAAALILAAAVGSAWWSKRLTPISPALASAREFSPAPIPTALPDTPPPADPEVMDGSLNQETYPDTVARLCRRLRDDPSDDSARFRLWGLLTIVPYPERIGDPVPAEGPITGVTMFSGGRRAAIVSEDGVFRVLSLETGEVSFRHDVGAPIRSLAATPGENLAAAGGDDGMLYVFDFSGEGGPLRSEFFAGTSPVRCLAFTRDGSRLLSGDDAGTLRAWPARQGGNYLWSRDLEKPPVSLRVHPDQTRFGCAFADGEVRVFTLESGSGTGLPIPASGPAAGFAFSKNPDDVILARSAGGIEIWNFRSGTLREQPRTVAGGIRALSSDPANDTFAAGGDGGQALIHRRTRTGRWRRTASDTGISAVAELKNWLGSYVVTGHEDGRWRLWAGHLRRAQMDPVRMAEPVPVEHLAVDPERLRLVAAGGTTAQAWDLHHRASNSQPLNGAGFVTGLAFPPGTGLVRFMGGTGSILFDLESGAATGQAMPIPPGANRTAISRDGLWIAASYGERVRVWNAPIAGKARPMREIALDAKVTALRLAPEGRFLAAATEKGGGGVWDSQTDRAQLRIDPDPAASEARSVALGDRLVAVGFQNGRVKIFDRKDGEEISADALRFGSAVEALALSPDDTTLGAGDRNGVTALFDVATGQRIDTEFVHSGGILAVHFSHDGKWMTTASRDRYAAFHEAGDGRYLFRSYRWFAEMLFAATNPEQTDLLLMSPNAPGPSYQKIPPHREHAPALLLEFAEAFAGFRYDENGERRPIPFSEYRRIRSEIVALPENGSAMRTWLRWLATHPRERTSGMPGK